MTLKATGTLFRWNALAVAPLVCGLAVWTAGCGGGGKTVGSGGGGGGGGTVITANILTIAGTGASGFNGDGRLLRETALYWPQDTYVDRAGRLWIVDWNNHRVRRADSPFGPAITAFGSGFIGDTRSGPANQADLNHPTSLCEDAQGRMVVATWHNWTIKRINADGIVDVIAGRCLARRRWR